MYWSFYKRGFKIPKASDLEGPSKNYYKISQIITNSISVAPNEGLAQ